MRPERQPENKGGRPPPQETEANWSLKEGEMTPQESRTLGHPLYAGIFTGLTQPVYSALQREYEYEYEPTDDLEPFDVSMVSAERYIEKYAQIYGLHSDLLKRWAHQASIELANATIPVLIQERERMVREEWWSPAQVDDYTQDMIDPIAEVAQQGIISPVAHHFDLVGEAYYMDRDLEQTVPLNSSLVRGIFDNRQPW
jgi:hypothetical protein